MGSAKVQLQDQSGRVDSSARCTNSSSCITTSYKLSVSSEKHQTILKLTRELQIIPEAISQVIVFSVKIKYFFCQPKNCENSRNFGIVA